MAKRKKKPDGPIIDKRGRPFPPTDARQSSDKRFVDKGGHPYAIKDHAAAIATLSGLGAILATSKECAAVLGVSEVTLFAYFKRVPEAHDAWVSGKEQGKVSLRRSQFKLAEKNATMAIFLGMNVLGQRDRREFAGDPEKPIKHEHEHGGKVGLAPDLSSLSTGELARLFAAKAAETPEA